ncbi:unnamed protein product [Ilex paraguariensis]|uniref:Uncharacterized protein n=1 Tax=Ilex paraguariensis TaxID=185542 RepID=A0ABC8TES8_9AQUA
MEPANLHHQHQLQDHQLVGSSPLATPSCYGGGSTHDWTSNNIFSINNFNPNINGGLINSRDPRQLENHILSSSQNSCMNRDLGFQWASSATTGSFNSRSMHVLDSNINEELSDSYPKFNEMTNSPSSSIEDLHLHPTSSIKNERRDFNDLSEKLMLRTLSSGSAFKIEGLQLPTPEFYSNPQFSPSLQSASTACRGIFSQILPTINISNLNQSSSAISSSSDMNLQVLDLLTSSRFSGSFSQPSHEHLGLFKDSPFNGLDIMHQSSRRPSNSSSQVISSLTNGVTEAKRSSSFLEPKAPQAAPKKSRLAACCPPFKVMK